MIRRSTKLLLPLILLFVSGCAYFNTFYNTKHYFDTAEKNRLETTSGKPKTEGYNKSIESGSRLIEYYPESEYIDDALFIMGQSYYWIGDYHKARRKFEELQSNYPNSEFLDDSRLWLGKTYVQLKKRQESTNILRSLIADTDDPELLAGAQFALAELYFNDSLFSKAEDEFLQAIEVDGSDIYTGEAYWRAGDAAMRAHDYAKAAEFFKNATRFDLSKRLKFQANLNRGRALRLAGELKESRNILENLLDDKRYFDEHGKVRVELALTLRELGRQEEAQKLIDETVELYNRTEISARALYESGMWRIEDGDAVEARELMDRARTERARSLYSMKADTMLQLIDRVSGLNNLRHIISQRIGRIESWVEAPSNPKDSTEFSKSPWYDAAALDSLKLVKLFQHAYTPVTPESPDTTVLDSSESAEIVSGEELLTDSTAVSDPPEVVITEYTFNPAPVLDTLAQLRVDLQDTRFQLGEILLFDLADVDSARAIFSELAYQSSVDTVRARALLALAYIEASQGDVLAHDSLFAQIGEEYGGTRFGKYVREKAGEETIEDDLTPDRTIYLEAEELYVLEQYQEAFSRYVYLIDRYPNSKLLASSLYAAGYISAKYLNDTNAAESMFSRLITEYPTTPQGVQASTLLASLDNIRRQEMADSLGVDLLDDSNALAEEEVEDLPTMIGGVEALASILDSRNLLPQEVIQGTGGEVLLRYIVHADGSVSGFRIMLEDPPGRGLGRALISGLEQMDYRPGRKDGESVAVRVERRFSLPLDAPPNIRPLPKRHG